MAEFRIQHDVETWLKGRSREESVVFAARAALRVLPALGLAVESDSPTSAAMTLPLLRVMAVPWFAAAYPDRGAGSEYVRSVAAARAAARTDAAAAASAAPAYAASAASAAAAAAAAAAPAYAYAATSVAASTSAAASAAASTDIDAYTDAAVSAYAAAAADAGLLDADLMPSQLAFRPLWPAGQDSDWATKAWQQFKATLLADGDHWRVWTDWYEDRLEGRPPQSEAVELARVMLAEEFWEGGPAKVNRELMRILKDDGAKLAEPNPAIEDIPPQISAALTFGGDDASPIVAIEASPQTLADTLDQRAGHQHILQKARALEACCGPSNRLTVLKGYATRVIDAAGDRLTELKLRAFWSAMNSLRRRLEADSLARTAVDPETPPLPEEVKGALEDLVDELNLFAAHEPQLVALDLMKGDPELRVATPPANAAVSDLISGAKEQPQVVAPSATEAIERVAADATGNSPSAVRARTFSLRSAVNLVLELIRRAYKVISSEVVVAWKGMREGAYRGIGLAGTGYGAAFLIHKHEAAVRQLIDLLGGYPTLHKVVDLIIRTLS